MASFYRFTTTTRILRVFAFLCKLVLLLFNINLASYTKFKCQRKNEKNSGRNSKMTPFVQMAY